MAQVLIVDDDDLMRQTLRNMLSTVGHDVEETINGVEALKILETKTFDVVVTDIVMPQKEGIELIHDLKQDYPGIRILAISAGAWGGKFDYLESAKKLGAHGVLAKPFTAKALRKAVEDCLG